MAFTKPIVKKAAPKAKKPMMPRAGGLMNDDVPVGPKVPMPMAPAPVQRVAPAPMGGPPKVARFDPKKHLRK